MSLFPIFVKLDARVAVVVDGGALAEAKVAGLLEAGATVRVVAPSISAAIRELVDKGRVTWVEREFFATDVVDAAIVFGATGKRKVDVSVVDIARRFRVLANAVDDPDFCDFYMPAIVRRGDLQIAISTNGQSPALAQQLRQHLERQFGPDWEKRVYELGARRREII